MTTANTAPALEWEYAPEGADTCTAMTDAPEGVDLCQYGDGVGFCGLIPGHASAAHLCVCGEHTF